jgi:hypothetical protein
MVTLRTSLRQQAHSGRSGALQTLLVLAQHVSWCWHSTSAGVGTARQLVLAQLVSWCWHSTSAGVGTARQLVLVQHVSWCWYSTSLNLPLALTTYNRPLISVVTK